MKNKKNSRKRQKVRIALGGLVEEEKGIRPEGGF